MKTLYLLAYIDDEAYRRRILVQLNRGEGRHRLARIVFHGKRGELRQRYREGRKTNSARSAWSSTPSCCGTRSTWTPRSPSSGRGLRRA